MKVGGKWGYIDRAGTTVIKPQFDSAENFHRGLAAVLIGEPIAGKGKWGYIDRSGRYVLGPDEHYTYAGFENGLMPVAAGVKWGYIDPTGRQVIPPRFRYARVFSEGLAGVEDVDGTGKDGFIDAAGKVVIPLIDAKLTSGGFNEGLAAVVDERTAKLGYIDTKGQFAIAPRFDIAEEFADGRAAVCLLTEDADGWLIRKWGFIDTSGAVVVPIQFDHVWSFSERLARVEVGGKVGFIDRDGKQVIPCQFDSAEPFRDGLALVNVGGWAEFGWSGYVDKAGRYVWRPSDYERIDRARHDHENQTPSIRLFTDAKTAGKGLLVTCMKRVQAKGPHAGEVAVTVANLLDEEVFVDVSGIRWLGGSFEAKDGTEYVGGGSFADGNLLKRLHAAVYRGEKPVVCGCCVAHIPGWVPSDVLAMGKVRGQVDVWLHGYYRNTGKAFNESVRLPVEIGDWPDDGELLRPARDIPATRPLSEPALPLEGSDLFPLEGNGVRDSVLNTLLADKKIPKDIPVPAKTPFDPDPTATEARAEYLNAYRLGFAEGVTGSMVIRCFGRPPPDSYQQGHDDGRAAGDARRQLRWESELHRHLGFSTGPDSHELTDDSPKGERQLRDEYGRFVDRFVTALRQAYPKTMTLKVSRQPSVYSYLYNDYSKSNADKPRSTRQFKGTLYLLAFMADDPKRRGTQDDELQGSYSFYFDRTEDGGWAWDDSRETLMLMHLQKTSGGPLDEPSGSWVGKESALARKLIEGAIDQARNGRATTRPRTAE